MLNISGDSWNNWGADVDDSTYIGDLALAQLGLPRDPDAVVAVEELAPEAPEEVPVEEAPKPAKKAAKKKTASE